MEQSDALNSARNAAGSPLTSVAELPGQVIDQLATALLKAAAERHSTERLLLYRLKQAATAGRVSEVLSIVTELSGETMPTPAR